MSDEKASSPPYTAAVKKEHREEIGIEIEEEDFPGRLLHQAALWDNAELLEDLLAAGGTLLESRDSWGRTALHAAAITERSRCLRLLLERGAAPDAQCGPRGENRTALHLAAEHGYEDNVSTLLQHDASMLVRDANGMTAYDIADKCGHRGCMRLLRDAADARERSRQETHAALRDACGVHEDAAAVRRILGSLPPGDAGLVVNMAPGGANTLLFLASQTGRRELVRALLEHGADGRCHPVTRYSPLYIACYHGHRDVAEMLLSRFPELVQLHTVERWLPAHACCLNGHWHVLDLLLRYPYPARLLRTYAADACRRRLYRMAFDINELDVTGQSPLYMASLLGNGRTVDIILDFRVSLLADNDQDEDDDAEDLHDKNEEEERREIRSQPEPPISPTRRRISHGIQSIMSRLRGSPNTSTETPADEPDTLCPVLIDQYCNNGSETALHAAVKARHYSIVQRLLRAGANSNAPLRSEDGGAATPSGDDELCTGKSTALVEACRNRDVPMAELLLANGATDDECRALCVAVRNRDEVLTARLLSTKANPDPEYKINKRAVQAECVALGGGVTSGGGLTSTYSSLFPNQPVMINWHNQRCHLSQVRANWLTDAALRLNSRLKQNPRRHDLALYAITRLDMSSNSLVRLPDELFRLASLRTLNLAQNKIERLPEPRLPNFTGTRDRTPPQSPEYRLPALEELYLQDNRLEELPDALFGLPSLVSLVLSNNKLQRLPYEMWRAPKLKELNVSFNLLCALPDERVLDQEGNASEKRRLLARRRDADANSADRLSVSSSDGQLSECETPRDETVPPREPVVRYAERGRGVVRLEPDRRLLWCRNVDVTEQILHAPDVDSGGDGDEETDAARRVSQLSSLNLAHNMFTVVPEPLACLAVNLTRLNMSFNSLRSMGYVTSYPATLKQLDLSHNQILCWPSLPPVPTRAYGDVPPACEAIACFACGGRPAPARPVSPPDAGARSMRAAVLRSVCAHRRHLRLEQLRTLILAGNRLRRLQLSTDDDSDELLSPPAEVDEGERVAALGSGGTGDRTERGSRSRLLFPNLSMLDVSDNGLHEVPAALHELANLSVLNISGNPDICELPPQMGLLSRLWNLNTRGCSLHEPLRSMIESKKYKTMDVVGYLKSVLEDARPYARMKLMLVGVQGIGKTSLLEQLRHEGGTSRSHSAGGGGVGGVFAPADHEHHNHWTRRMGHHHHHAEALHGSARTARGVNMSTVGVDIGDWVYERPKRAGASHGPVTFRTWDFGGQKEYYATHQYFLSRRSLYLVVWRILDGQRGIADILQWLVNIQARAPNSPVIIVGTHYDLVHERWRDSAQRSEELQQAIRDRFINVVDAEKCGLPRVLDTIEVSCRTRHNIRLLCNLLYETAFSLRPPGSKEPLLEQRVPASYLALEDAVAQLSARRRSTGFDPVLTAAEYRAAVGAEMHARRARPFRDAAELHQATLFLHENGVLLHYDDATLRDLYFLDPQWLCDMLAHVVTIREINPFARSGVMRLDDLRHLFKASGALGAVDHGRGYIVSLLNKFEVALTWDSRTLLIPSLLPDERLGQPAVRVRVPVRSRGRAAARVKPSSGRAPPPVLVSPRSLQYPGDGSSTTTGVAGGYPISDSVTVPPPLAAGEREHAPPPTQPPSENAITRLLLMSYFPSGFWSRLVSRILADDTIVDIVRSYFTPPKESVGDPEVARALLELRAEWLLWQTGLRLRYGDITLFRMREVPRDFQLHQTHERDQQQVPSFPSLPNCYEPDYRRLRFRLKQEGAWGDVDLAGSSVLELHFPMQALAVGGVLLEATVEPVTQLLALAVDHIDTLLEDWYPTLGTRFVHTSEGRFLVTRLVPCPRCLSEVTRAPLPPEERADDAAVAVGLEPYEALGAGERHGAYNRKSQESYTSETDSGVGAESVGSSRAASTEGRIGAVESDRALYGWTIEECILAAHETTRAVRCPMHGDAALSLVSPDVVFLDLGERYLLRPETVKRGRLLGRGAFGFVFRGTCRARGSHSLVDVALKMLQPVAPGTGARQSALVAYRAAQGKWERDPLQHACKAYCTARQELSILLSLRHPNVVPLVGVCASPLALVLDLAPGGALDARLRHYRRSGARLAPPVLRQLVLQTARAVEYLHRQRIIYRDLKSENVLVWRLPEPFAQATAVAEADGEAGTHVKLADYGISRTALPGGAKGFGGTEGFMAPEIMRHNGEQEYTEKVDCFSFGMYVYELLTLRQPFEGHESVKECILEGGRPPLTRRQTISHPPHCLDLMVLCWAHDPRRRPSASQIVSIASAPEFARLADVIALPHAGVVMAATASPPLSGAPSSSSGQGASGQARELWLACANQRVDLLLAIGARLPRLHSLMAPRRATAACTVGAAVWLGDCTGQIHAYSAANATRLFTCGLSAIGTHGQETPVSPSEPPSVGRDEGEKDMCAVLCMAYARSLTLVACGLSDGRLLLLDADSGSIVAKVRHEPSDIAQVVCVVGEELWVGGPGGRMTVYTLEKIRERHEDSVLDAIIMLEHQQPAVEGAVVLSAVSDAEGDADGVWTYVHPGCVVYQWEARARRIANRLDCSKLVPCSESLRSIAIEEHLSPGRCQVTSMAVSGDDLYIGTTWGCLIVAERATLRPVTVFRPYEEEVKAVLPLRFAGAEPLVATVGRGYRSLLARYTDQPDEDEPLYDAGQQQGTHVLLWRADNWAAA